MISPPTARPALVLTILVVGAALSGCLGTDDADGPFADFDTALASSGPVLGLTGEEIPEGTLLVKVVGPHLNGPGDVYGIVTGAHVFRLLVFESGAEDGHLHAHGTPITDATVNVASDVDSPTHVPEADGTMKHEEFGIYALERDIAVDGQWTLSFTVEDDATTHVFDLDLLASANGIEPDHVDPNEDVQPGEGADAAGDWEGDGTPGDDPLDPEGNGTEDPSDDPVEPNSTAIPPPEPIRISFTGEATGVDHSDTRDLDIDWANATIRLTLNVTDMALVSLLSLQLQDSDGTMIAGTSAGGPEVTSPDPMSDSSSTGTTVTDTGAYIIAVTGRGVQTPYEAFVEVIFGPLDDA